MKNRSYLIASVIVWGSVLLFFSLGLWFGYSTTQSHYFQKELSSYTKISAMISGCLLAWGPWAWLACRSRSYDLKTMPPPQLTRYAGLALLATIGAGLALGALVGFLL